MNINEHQAAVQAELERIVIDLTRIAKQNPKTGDWVAVPATEDMGDADGNLAADVTEEWNERRALMTQLETRYRNLVKATEKLSTGTYGLCEICNDQIEGDRLHANVAARTCIAHLENEAELSI